MLTNIAKSVLSLVGGPLVTKAADLAVDSIDKLLSSKPAEKPPAPPSA